MAALALFWLLGVGGQRGLRPLRASALQRIVQGRVGRQQVVIGPVGDLVGDFVRAVVAVVVVTTTAAFAAAARFHGDLAGWLDGWMDALLHSFWAGLAIEGRYGDVECACLTLQPSRPKFHAASTPARSHSPNTCIAPLSVRDFRRVSQ